jgi:apolipoprotein N-acyltransferase
VTAVAGALHYAGASPTAVFLLCGVALGGLAWLIGLATESVGAAKAREASAPTLEAMYERMGFTRP